MNNSIIITVQTNISQPIDKIWRYWTDPEHVKKWNNASQDWHTLRAENDLKIGGEFVYRMEAKNGTAGFDFDGEYTNIVKNKLIEFKMGDGRKVSVEFIQNRDEISIIEKFEAENVYPIDYQKQGWQAILDNFKNYVENN